jgi:hypothetical protein
VFLEILRTLESFSTEIALMWLERNVDSNMRCDMIALDGGGAALIPTTSEVQVICAFASDMLLADVLL